jgi:ATP-dependent helicase/nuclease subunit B
MDYKTGDPPSEAEVESGAAPQLVLEAVMAEHGAFGAELQGRVTELGFWKLSGRAGNGEDKSLFKKSPDRLLAAIATAAARIAPLLQKFGNPATPYLATPHPARAPYRDPYHGVSRRGEWGGEISEK